MRSGNDHIFSRKKLEPGRPPCPKHFHEAIELVILLLVFLNPCEPSLLRIESKLVWAIKVVRWITVGGSTQKFGKLSPWTIAHVEPASCQSFHRRKGVRTCVEGHYELV